MNHTYVNEYHGKFLPHHRYALDPIYAFGNIIECVIAGWRALLGGLPQTMMGKTCGR